MKKPVIIKQRDITDCGAACLASIAKFYGLDLSVARIRQLASTDQKGTNILGLVEAASKLKLNAKGVKGELDSLTKIPKPAIAHIIVNHSLHHYVVIYHVDNKNVKVMDPGPGKMKSFTHNEFNEMWTGVLVLITPDNSFETGKKNQSISDRFFRLIQPHRSTLIQAMFGGLIYTVLGLSTSIYVQKIIDHVIVRGNHNLLNLLSVVMIGLLVVQVILNAFKAIFVLKTGQQIDASLILGYYQHLIKLPQHFFNTMRVGEVISRVNDAVKIRAFINDVSINLIVDVFIVAFSFVLMFSYYWKLAVIMCLVIPCYLMIYWITNRLNKKVERKAMENMAELESQLVESINGIRTIKLFGLESHANLKTEVKFVQLLRSVYKSGLNNIFSVSSSESVSRLFTIILLWVGTGFVLGNQVTTGELLSFYALIGYFTGPASSLIGANKTMQNALIAADRLFEIMDLELEEQENQLQLHRHEIGDIAFRDVHFRYGTRKTVFENLNLKVEKGKVTAIVGESGSGKSTIASILQKLYPLDNGQIMIGKYDIKYVSNQSIRKMIGMVPQHTDLFAGNIIDNIAVGDYEPDIKKIITICTNLGMMGFIENLPNGLSTYIGENGTTLSGGQRQRLAIARALYRDPEILVFDEATSSLDSKSEDFVRQVVQEFKGQGKTVILIAHRMATVFEADQIILIDQGKVVEYGSHASLMVTRGEYYQMWKRQFPIDPTGNFEAANEELKQE